MSIFTARRSYASAVLGVVILSVCPSVCPSVSPSVCHTRALRLIQRTYRRYFYTIWKGNPLVFCHPTVVGGRRPLPPLMGDRSDPPPFKSRSRRQISACNVSTVRASEKVQLWRIGSRTGAFQRAIDEVRTLPLSLPKDDSKSELFRFWNKSQLQLNEVCYKVCLRVNFQ